MAGGVLAHGLLSPGGSSPLRPGTVRPSLPPSSLPRRPFGSPCGVRSLGGRLRADHVPPASRAGWDPASF